MTDSGKTRIDANEIDSKVIHNITFGNPVTKRSPEWDKVVDFLDIDFFEETDNGQVTYPPDSIMLVSGPKGVGKSTLALQACHKKMQEGGDYKAIIWFNKHRFLDLLYLAPDFLKDRYSRTYADQSVPAFRQYLDDHDGDRANLDLALKSFHQSEPEATLSAPSPIVRQLFRDVQPYLLIIDDIDGESKEQTRAICDQLEWVHVPNKAIVTSRIPDLDFKRPVHFFDLPLGLLSKEEADKIAGCECEERLPQQYWVEDNLEQTKQWLWEHTGGLPDIILATIRNAKSNSKRLGTTTHWLSFFQEYAGRYLEGDSKASTADTFAQLNAQEKYLLVALARATPLPPRSRVDFLIGIGIHEYHPEWDRYSEAITSLSAKRFLGYKVKWHGPAPRSGYDQEWQLHPFMRDLIEGNLEEYTNGEYQQVRANLWLEFFSYYAISDKSRVDLLEYRDQGLTGLSWLAEQKEWAKVVLFGKTIANVLLPSHRASLASKLLPQKSNITSQFVEACRQVVTAAENSGNVNENAHHRLLLLKNIPFGEYPNIPREQLEGLLKLRSQFDMLGSDLKSSVAAYYANIAMREGNVEEAKRWLDRGQGLGTYEDVLRARLTLADHLVNMSQFTDALNEVEKVKAANLGKKSEMNEVAIIACQLIAKIMYLQGQLDESRAAYLEATELTEAANYLDSANDFRKAVALIDLQLSSNPLENIGLSIDALYPLSLTTALKCTACNHKITSHEIWLGQTVACPSCAAIFHERCINELGLSQCPLCDAPLPVVSQGQG